ncbi:MAG: S8 family serine peptidase, partial [Anaeromyxobacteraceae bacterium]|nr:S8 family serine peptidase [Anaeromyxobacteraceae bacterium]
MTHGRLRPLSLTLLLVVTACSGRPADTASTRSASVRPVTDGPQALPSSRAGAARHVIVQLTERPTAVVYRGRLNAIPLGVSSGDAGVAATDAAVQQLTYVRSEQEAFAGRVADAAVPGTTELFRLQRVYNGIVYRTDDAGVARLRALPGARAVHDLALHEVENARGVAFVGAPQLWSLGVPVRGDGIRVGVIDTGIDYLHANFGGPGTKAAFDANDPNLVEAGSFPTAKVVGGWDFAGGAYNAAADATSFPVPDADPLDRSGHGSHVAGTIAGLGVTLGGSSYAGAYDATLDPTTLRIGPGAAPGASLYALKVFGDGGGSTALSALAVEWAADPNGDGDFSDRLDVVNLSLGSSYGSPSDTEAIFYRNAVNAGVVVVASAGNSNDVYFITGSPGATPEVVSVAATSVGASTAIRVNAPAALAGLKPAGTANPPAPLPSPLTGDLVLAVDGAGDVNDGCTPFSNAADVAGKIALIRRGTCTFLAKAQNAQAAGAVGYLIANMPTSGWPITMAVDATITIPGFIVQNADRVALEAAIAAGDTINVTFDNLLVTQDLAFLDTIAGFSSRGPTRLLGQPMLKPDVAAPGVNVISTSMGTGSEGTALSGTSMAAPLTAGVMALLRQLHPTWTPAELKAALMNTAGHDLFNLPSTNPARLRVGPGRVGAGRIDAAAAGATAVLAYDKAAPERVSVSFATIDVAGPITESRTIELKNKGATDVTFDVTTSAAVSPAGVTVAPGAATVTVLAGATADLPLALAADPAAMVRARDATTATAGATPFGNLPRNWLSEASGWVVLTPQGGGTALRVPYFAAPVPASAMAATAPLATTGAAGTSPLALAGTGVDTRALAASPAGVVSLATPFELAFASPRAAPLGGPLPVGYPSAEADIANLRYVGVATNL